MATCFGNRAEGLLYPETNCAVCRGNVDLPPFIYGIKCGCVYHVDCLETKIKCITHRGSQLALVDTRQCICLDCQSLTSNVICRVSLDQIGTRMQKIIGNAGGMIDVGTAFAEVFAMKSLWPEAVNCVSRDAVDSHGNLKRRQHPLVALAWPIVWKTLKEIPDLILVDSHLWLNWHWVETQLDHLLPRFINYSEICTLVPTVDERRVTAFKTAVQLGKTKRFHGISSAGVHRITKLGCYDYGKTIEKINSADYSGIAECDLLKENENMLEFIEKMVAEGKAVIIKRRVYSLRNVGDCHPLLEKVWKSLA